MLQKQIQWKQEIWNIQSPSNTQQVKTADLNMSYVTTSWSLAFIRFNIFSFTAEGNDLQNKTNRTIS